jgi:hypothetical protein
MIPHSAEEERMAHGTATEPDGHAERDFETEGIKMATLVEWVSPYDGRPRSRAYETYEEVQLKVAKLLNRGHHEEDIVVVARFTNG